MGWWSWPTAMCEAEKAEESDKDQQQGEQKEQPQEKDQQKDQSGGQEKKGSEPAQSSGEGRKKGDSGEPKNIGDDAKTAEKETEKAKEQHEGTAHASSRAGQQEPVAVRKFSDEEAQRRREEHEEQGGNKSDDAPDPDDEEHVQVKTVPYDPRFPATNQARNCYTRYNEFYKCIADKGEDDAECKFYQRAYRSICPSEWVEGWNTAREEGNWFGKY